MIQITFLRLATKNKKVIQITFRDVVSREDKSDSNHFPLVWRKEQKSNLNHFLDLAHREEIKEIQITFFKLQVSSFKFQVSRREGEITFRSLFSITFFHHFFRSLFSFFDHFFRSLFSITFLDHFLRSLFSITFFQVTSANEPHTNTAESKKVIEIIFAPLAPREGKESDLNNFLQLGAVIEITFCDLAHQEEQKLFKSLFFGLVQRTKK